MVSPKPVPRDQLPFLDGGGEAAALIAGFDWSATSMGDIQAWSPVMRSTLALILRSRVPIVTLWGTDGIMIYNDAYADFAGTRHPQLLGSKVREGWIEIADFNDNVMRVGLAGGTLVYRDQEMALARDGRLEQVWLDLDYSPILDEEGVPGGVMAIVTETTQRVLAQRSMKQIDAQLRRAQEAGGVGVFTIDLEEDALYGTPELYRLFGLPVADKLPATAVERLVLPTDASLVSSSALRRSGSIPLDVEYHIRRADTGEIRALARKAEYEYDASGRPIRLVGIVQDVTERRDVQNALEESAAQFRAFAQAMPNQAWAADPGGLLDWFNEQVYVYSGAAYGTLDGSRWTSMIHADDIEVAAQRWATALSTGGLYETEFRLRRADGEFRWHLARALPIRNADHQITRWIGTNTDIHERKIAETLHVRDRDRMWMMSQDLMLVCTFDGLITAVNPSATRLLGWDPSDLIGRPLSEFLHPDDYGTTVDELGKLSRGMTTLAFENRYRTREGIYRLLDWTAVPDGERIHAVGRDITAERAAARDHERIWTLSPVLKVVSSMSGTVSTVNPAWTEALGWSLDATRGKNLLDFITEEDRKVGAAALLTLSSQGSLRDQQLSVLTQAGERRQIVWSFVRENETIYGFGRDVTEQRSAEEALRQSQKMEAVGQLTGGIAHDFNNLLQGITGSLDLVQKRIAQGRLSELDRFVSGAMTSANRASALTHRLLAFSRRQPLDPRPVRANPLVSSMEDLLRRTLGEGIELELVLAGGLWLTRCDPNQLESAILNLAINARDAMPAGGKLVIETCNAHLDSRYSAQQREVRAGQYVCICVTDTGTGMSADVAARAFEPFFTTKPIGQGTGLGLSMIYGFARQSEGYAKIYSELGKGTTLKIYLPRYRGVAPQEEDLPYLSDEHAAEAGETVLVVEDEPVVRGLIVEVLNDLGYRALEAADGPTGLEILQSKRRIDLLVTDVGLPGLNGRQVADAGRQLRPGLQVLFMTGYAENAALASGFLEPGMQMVTKPFAMEVLASRIREMIKSK
jgi:PAS domain S-box-containing protein